MTPLSCLADPAIPLITDTSVVINLNASGCAARILQALPNPVVVPGVVQRELEEGRRTGRHDADLLQNLVAEGLVEVAELESDVFEGLVVGPGANTLDDGEAATIACALEKRAIAVIDERKANRICREQFPELRMAHTVSLFAHTDVEVSLGRATLGNAVFNALKNARMRVLHEDMDWLIALIGPDRAALCSSLARFIAPENRARSHF